MWPLFEKYGFVLAGGTGLALHLGHRISYDLDFFTDKAFNNEKIIADIRKTGLPFNVSAESEGSMTVEIGGVKVSIFKYDYPFTEKKTILENIGIAGVLDIASMEIIAVCQRGSRRDFIDLYYILQEIPFHLLARHMIMRYGRERINPVHIGKSLVYFTDAEPEPEPDYIKGKEIAWKTVKQFFKNHVRQFVYDLAAASNERD